ncbi:MAG: AAA family ATPase [Magnetococcus sp. DMHC-6]
MKISRIKLENFKRFGNIEIFVKNNLTQDISDQFLLLGDNGTGKTTVLQAVALCLAMVSGKIKNISEFDWPGWVAGRYEIWGKPAIELDVHFSEDEILATQEVAQEWFENKGAYAEGKIFIRPGDASMVTVRLERNYYRSVGGTLNNIYQFRGRKYATDLLTTTPSVRKLFPRLPGVFWFDQYRHLVTENSYLEGVSSLRKYLNGWWMNKFAGGTDSDWLMELENNYKFLFPGRSFCGPEPMFRGGSPTPSDSYFILSDGHRKYDIEEMSAGEQSVFPMLYEFVRMQIRKSVILVDEIDLNLHPPLAQALLVSLPNIGPGCQFILTTHSEDVANLVSSEETFRLPGGRLCL